MADVWEESTTLPLPQGEHIAGGVQPTASAARRVASRLPDRGPTAWASVVCRLRAPGLRLSGFIASGQSCGSQLRLLLTLMYRRCATVPQDTSDLELNMRQLER
jgi:hypothetical protein